MSDVLSVAALSLGLVFFLAGSVGLLRFPDLLSRLHAVTKADNLGLGLITFGVVLQSPDPTFAVKAMLVWLVTVFASAVVGHLVARQAHAGAPQGDRSADR